MNKKMTFEEAMTKLNEIVGRMESGNESLETSLSLFEEGSALAAFCYGKLQNAEQKIKQITEMKEAGGEKDA
ncbi:exodeoxyribonuclease VII small subunit [Caproiciproducens galactitolivorans]|uniref:Exodeoxyribonuclease 7 small subunit n=1 Tax=Caproiciproducens galactitolivorans TaxID=642589 RepID=A0ABT4BTK0_9FIRM|nr:exodeoxyribonuclease VII small subunit [Caproiciproducens galactitolivorans]MCY1714232.1 exodeoxyribonuclease VII small subunit [Caproiciproducens galactitolivorans]